MAASNASGTEYRRINDIDTAQMPTTEPVNHHKDKVDKNCNATTSPHNEIINTGFNQNNSGQLVQQTQQQQTPSHVPTQPHTVAAVIKSQPNQQKSINLHWQCLPRVTPMQATKVNLKKNN